MLKQLDWEQTDTHTDTQDKLIGERELVVQLAQFFGIFIYLFVYPGAAPLP